MLGLALCDELTQALDDVADTQRLVGAAVHGLAHAVFVKLARVQQGRGAAQITCDRGQRLIELVRERGRHLTHGGQPRHVQQLRLQLLHAALLGSAFGQVADEAGKVPLGAGFGLADCELHRKGRAILALADHDPPDPDDAALARAAVAIEIAIVLLPVRCRRQDGDIVSDRLRGRPAKEALGRDAEGSHDAPLIEHDHGFRDGIQDRLELGLPISGIFGLLPQPASDHAEDRSHDREEADIDQVRRVAMEAGSEEIGAASKAEQRGEDRGPAAAGKCRKDDDRNVDHGEGPILERVMQGKAQTEDESGGGCRRPVAKPKSALCCHSVARCENESVFVRMDGDRLIARLAVLSTRGGLEQTSLSRATDASASDE